MSAIGETKRPTNSTHPAAEERREPTSPPPGNASSTCINDVHPQEHQPPKARSDVSARTRTLAHRLERHIQTDSSSPCGSRPPHGSSGRCAAASNRGSQRKSRAVERPSRRRINSYMPSGGPRRSRPEVGQTQGRSRERRRQALQAHMDGLTALVGRCGVPDSRLEERLDHRREVGG